MFRYAVAGALILVLAAAGAGFTFVIGSPVASQDFQVKAAAFVVRTEGCESSPAQISATAEGLVKDERRSVALKVQPVNKPGVYAIFPMWPPEGRWVVNLKGTCGAASAGAIVPIGPKGFIRDAARFFPRPATDREVEASLAALK